MDVGLLEDQSNMNQSNMMQIFFPQEQKKPIDSILGSATMEI
jgi:hypothetical protein